jgi:hypothetical protein
MKSILTFFALVIAFNISALAQTTLPKRYVLIEHFTNTYCPTCANNNPNLYSVLNAHEDTDAYHIAYHWSVPLASDQFYQANTAEIDERDNYYNVLGSPSSYLQGTLNDVGSPLLNETQITPYLNQTSPIALAVSETTNGTQRNVTVTVQTLGTVPAGNWKLRLAVVERNIVYTAPNLETTHRNVFRKTVSGWNTNFTPPTAGNSVTLNYSYALSTTWNAAQTYVVAFVQNDNDKQILNTATSWGQVDVPLLKLKLKALLEGVYNSTTNLMNTQLLNNSSGNLLPTAQPFNITPYNYSGTESVNSFPSNTVDWVLVELRNGTNGNNVVARKAALLLADGTIRDASTAGATDGITFAGIGAGNYHIALKTRTHLAVLSANTVALPNSTALDLSNATNVMGGSAQLALVATGKYGLLAGDYTHNGTISVTDYNGYAGNIGVNQYKASDFNLNGNVTVADFNLLRPNLSRIAVPQVRY